MQGELKVNYVKCDARSCDEPVYECGLSYVVMLLYKTSSTLHDRHMYYISEYNGEPFCSPYYVMLAGHHQTLLDFEMIQLMIDGASQLHAVPCF